MMKTGIGSATLKMWTRIYSDSVEVMSHMRNVIIPTYESEAQTEGGQEHWSSSSSLRSLRLLTIGDCRWMSLSRGRSASMLTLRRRRCESGESWTSPGEIGFAMVWKMTGGRGSSNTARSFNDFERGRRSRTMLSAILPLAMDDSKNRLWRCGGVDGRPNGIGSVLMTRQLFTESLGWSSSAGYIDGTKK